MGLFGMKTKRKLKKAKKKIVGAWKLSYTL